MCKEYTLFRYSGSPRDADSICLVIQYGTAQLQGNEYVQVTRENLATHAHASRVHALLRAASKHSLVFELTSRQSRLAMMPSLLCGSPNYLSSFAEHHNLLIAIVLSAR